MKYIAGKMRKIALATFIVLTNVMVLCAHAPQSIFSIDSSAVRWQKLSSIVSGVNPPSSAGPWTEYELSYDSPFFDNQNRLSIEHPFVANLDLAFEIYLQNRRDDDFSSSDWYHSYNERQGFINVEGEGIFGNFFFAKFGFEGKNTHNYDNNGQGEAWFKGIFNSNFILSSGASLEDTAPFEAVAALAQKNLSLIGGRSKVKYGRGHSGNLLISDNLLYQDFVQFSAWNKTLTYKYLMVGSNLIDGDGKAEPITFRGDTRLFVNHRLEVNITKWLRFTINEGALFYSDRLDFRIFNPLMFLHNYHNSSPDLEDGMYDEVNNYMQFEVEVAIIPKLSFHTQIFIDQIEEIGEMLSHNPVGATPNAWGVLSGFELATKLSSGMLSAYIEAVYTSPYLYLRGNEEDTNFDSKGGWNLSLLAAHDTRTSYGVGYFGYNYGPDTVLVEGGVEYEVLQSYKVGFTLQFGAFGAKALLKDLNLETGQAAFNLVSPSGNVTYRLVNSVEGFYYLGKSKVRLNGALDQINIWNSGNYQNTIQFTVGVNYSLDIF